MTTEEEIVKIKGEMNQIEIAKKDKIFKMALLIGIGATLPITVPMFGGDTQNLMNLLKIAIPGVGIGSIAGSYYIHKYKKMIEERRKKLNELENYNVELKEPEEKGMKL